MTSHINNSAIYHMYTIRMPRLGCKQYNWNIHVSFDKHAYEKDHDMDVVTWDALTQIDD